MDNEFLFERDYGEDYFEFDRLYRDQLDRSHSNFREKLNLIQEGIIASQNAAYACFLALENKIGQYKMQKVVLTANNPKYLLFFAKYIKGADTKALEHALFESKHKNALKYLIQFAYQVSNADIGRIEKKLIKEVSQNKKYIFLAHTFLKNVKEANLIKFKQIILSSKKPRYLYALAKKVNNKRDIAKIEDLLIERQSFLYLRMMAQYIKNANIEKIEEAVLSSGNIKEIKKFAQTVKNCKSQKLSILF